MERDGTIIKAGMGCDTWAIMCDVAGGQVFGWGGAESDGT